jgi:hypothetical protein
MLSDPDQESDERDIARAIAAMCAAALAEK